MHALIECNNNKIIMTKIYNKVLFKPEMNAIKFRFICHHKIYAIYLKLNIVTTSYLFKTLPTKISRQKHKTLSCVCAIIKAFI